MTSDDLTKKQIDALTEQVGQRLRWLTKLCERFRQRQFPINDPLWTATEEARGHLGRLYRELYERQQGSRRG